MPDRRSRPPHPARPVAAASALLAALLLPGGAPGYPLDGAKVSGIRRLEGYANAQQDPGKRVLKLPPGALLGHGEVQIHLHGRNEAWDLEDAPRDPALQKALEAIVARRHPSYAIAVVDVTDPARIAWAGVREEVPAYPGSVGKIPVLVALFDGLRRAFPEPAERERVLRETVVEATDWSQRDSHKVPHFDPASGRNRYAPILLGERFALSEWVDHMVSSSANSAGSTVWKEAMLLRQFGSEYPVPREREEEFFRTTPKPKLHELSQAVIEEPLVAAGIDTSQVRQGTMFTGGGQRRVPGTKSFATPKQLARILLRIEQGRMVDPWSSREMKRYMYMTKKRYRYAYAPELADSAIYFKSGSMYRCAPEEGFRCKKYHGNVENEMNSVAIVETPARPGPEQRRYLVALMSNVLRKNSAWDHSRLGAAIDEAVRTRRPAEVKEQGTEQQLQDVGKSE